VKFRWQSCVTSRNQGWIEHRAKILSDQAGAYLSLPTTRRPESPQEGAEPTLRFLATATTGPASTTTASEVTAASTESGTTPAEGRCTGHLSAAMPAAEGMRAAMKSNPRRPLGRPVMCAPAWDLSTTCPGCAISRREVA
jgi:hypothetical protein